MPGNDATKGNSVNLADLSRQFGDADDLANAIQEALKEANEVVGHPSKPEAESAAAGDAAPKTAGLAEIGEPPPGSAPATPEAREATPSREQEYYERLLRVTADFENYKKRAAREKGELARFANEDLLLQFLPVDDNFERALSHAEQSKDIGALIEGVRMILRQMRDVMQRVGVRSFESLGKPFDPTKHQAVQLKETAEAEPNTVIEEYQRGFFYHDRLLRPAMVVVADRPKNLGESGPVPSGAPLEELEPID